MITFIILLFAFIFVMNLTRIHDNLCMVFSKIDEKL
jgi:hypothetical protein